MSQVNAPQPSTSGPAEIFDATIAGTNETPVSSDGNRGPNTTEAPTHAGANNGIDPFFFKHFIALRKATWTVNQDPATLLFSVPIHPSECHQWMAHIGKMYNVWAGGIDFAVKVAGTGFHAGAIMCVRIPPNIQPKTLRTESDITAFEYSVIDPKTLEVISKSVMDQRYVMYHYTNEFNLEKPRTFGGYFCIYVLMPLNTSATGSAEITVQIFSKPCSDFKFSQLKPISLGPVIELYPPALEWALRLGKPVYCAGTADHAYFFELLPNIKSADFELVGCADFITGAHNIGVAPLSNGFSIGELVFAKGSNADYKVVLSSNKTITFRGHDFRTGDSAYFLISFIPKGYTQYITVMVYVKIDVIDLDRVTIKNDNSNIPERYSACSFKVDQWDSIKEGALLTTIFSNVKEVDIYLYRFVEKTIHADRKFIPPLPETIAFFSPSVLTSGVGKVCQSTLIRDAIIESKDSLHQGECFLLEFWDDDVNLPILPFKLYREGVFTTIQQSKNVTYNLNTKNYSLRIVSKGQANVPLARNARQISTYARNHAISNMAAFHIADGLNSDGSSSRTGSVD
ncbi:hypothetical protein 2 [Wuhan spider virus 6]|uniref:hypothetical protein 2 n=1 Tax=Wuhan spider virus 6 TaxID=1923755 RepID=UPI00090B6EAF|nr:hypothetical protein 2 [Wuhan spider virus 6]APG77416.1 hypothetical protein 2 [Wuhan spider virus 6]